MAEDVDRDVTLGEVYRLIIKLDERLDKFSSKFVPIELFHAAEKVHSDRYQALGRELAKEREERKADVKELEGRADADKRTKSAQWFAISLAGLVALFGIISSVASNILLQNIAQGGTP